MSSYFPPLTDDTPGMAAVRALVDHYAPDTPRNDYLIEGFIEGMILFEALKRAYSSGDMTQAGVVAAAKSIGELDFGGIAPNESYVGSANDRLQRKVWMSRPDPEGLAAGTRGTGTRLTDPAYTHPIAAAFVFRRGVLQARMNGALSPATSPRRRRCLDHRRVGRVSSA